MNQRSIRKPVGGDDPIIVETLICDWKDCPVAARFHIEIPLNQVRQLSGVGGMRMPFSRTHHNVCGAHLDEYSMMRAPKAIYSIGKCPHCSVAV